MAGCVFLVTLGDGWAVRSISDPDCAEDLLRPPSLSIIFGPHDREAVVRAARPQAGQQLP